MVEERGRGGPVSQEATVQGREKQAGNHCFVTTEAMIDASGWATACLAGLPGQQKLGRGRLAIIDMVVGAYERRLVGIDGNGTAVGPGQNLQPRSLWARPCHTEEDVIVTRNLEAWVGRRLRCGRKVMTARAGYQTVTRCIASDSRSGSALLVLELSEEGVGTGRVCVRLTHR